MCPVADATRLCARDVRTRASRVTQQGSQPRRARRASHETAVLEPSSVFPTVIQAENITGSPRDDCPLLAPPTLDHGANDDPNETLQSDIRQVRSDPFLRRACRASGSSVAQIARMTGDFPLTDRYPEDDVGTLMAFASLVPISIIVATLGAFLARRELWDLLTLAGILVNEMVAQTPCASSSNPGPRLAPP